MNIPETIRAAVNGDKRLMEKGRFVNAVMMMDVGEAVWRFDIRQGRVDSAQAGPFIMPSSTFRLRASAQEWHAFWQPVPRPGHHDIFAMMKRRVLAVEGDPHPFMANLFYFKNLLATPRGSL